MTTESFEPSAPHHPAASVTTITAGVEPESLRAVEMFADLRPDELAWIAAHAERVELERGQLLLVSGEPAEWMFIGIEGTIEVRREQLGTSVPSYVFRAGASAAVSPYWRTQAVARKG